MVVWLIDFEPAQTALLEKICSGPNISADDLRVARAFEVPDQKKFEAE